MKKTLSLLLIMVMAMTLVLAACGGGKDSGSNNTGNNNTPPKSNNSGSKDNGAGKEEPAKDPVTIKWGTWMGEEDVNRIIEAFEATHPHIKVEKDPAVDWPWNEKLAAVAAAGELPDVTWTFGVPVAAANGWLEDLTPYLETDPEYKAGKTFKNLDATANYDGKQYALPHSLFMFAVFLNLDLFEQENVPVPGPDWTVDDMREAAIALTKVNDKQFGLNNIKGMRETLSSAFDPSLEWNTWDGTKYNFSSPAFKENVNYIDDLLFNDKVALDIFTHEERIEMYGENPNPWMNSKVGMQYDGTWLINGNIENANFNWDIRPLPGAKGQRVPLITDYVGVTKSSAHKQEAFEFVKWLTYSKEGWMARMGADWPISSIPLINDEDVWNAYLSRDMPAGMKDLIAMIPNGFADPIKWLPGYMSGLSVYHETFGKIDNREAKLEDVAADLEKRMLDAYQSELDQLRAAN